MVDLPEWITRLTEANPQQYLPYAGHSEDPKVAITFDNSLLAMIQLHGLPFELMPVGARRARVSLINTLLRRLADADLSLFFHMVHHNNAASPAPQPTSSVEFVRNLMASYQETLLSPETVYRNDWFITVLVRQAAKLTRYQQVRDLLPGGKSMRPLKATRAGRHMLEDAVRTLMTDLADYKPIRLGLTEVPSDLDECMIPVSEIGSALYLIRTGMTEVIPHTTGSLAQAIYTNPVVFRKQHFDLNIPGVDRVGAMIGLGNYPVRPRPGMWNNLMSAPYPCVVSHSFVYRNPGPAAAAMALLQQQMKNAGDQAKTLAKGIDDAADATSSMKTAPGRHHFGLAVYAKTVEQLEHNVADATKRLSTYGSASPVREMNRWYNGAMPTAYFLQLPGCTGFKPRPGNITTEDLACMASLENFPSGDTEGHWGASPIRFKHNGLGEFDYVPHDDDVGHFSAYGRTGAGKTLLLSILNASFGPIMGKDGVRLTIDKDQSNRLAIEREGGIYKTLVRNRPSGLAPLVAFPNEPRTESLLHNLIRWMIHRDGRGEITPDEDARLKRGISCQLAMPSNCRSLGGIREFLGYSDRLGAGARFERWCAGGSMGWLVDNREHVISLGPGQYGIDITELIPQEGQDDDGACSIVAAVILHQLKGLMDGRRMAIFCDESKFYMEPLQLLFEDISLTGRKKDVILGLLAQQPEHHSDSKIGMSLISQTRTRFYFPDPSLDVDTLLNKHKLSKAAVRLLKGDMTSGGGRRFLLWRPPDKSAVIEFNLSDLPELPILSGREWTIALMDKVVQEVPEELVVAEFCHRVKNTKRRLAA